MFAIRSSLSQSWKLRRSLPGCNHRPCGWSDSARGGPPPTGYHQPLTVAPPEAPHDAGRVVDVQVLACPVHGIGHLAVIADSPVSLEVAVSGGAARMNHALRSAFSIEVGDLLEVGTGRTQSLLSGTGWP